MNVNQLRNGMWVNHKTMGLGIAAFFNPAGHVEYHQVAQEDVIVDGAVAFKKRDTVKVEVVNCADLTMASGSEVVAVDAAADQNRVDALGYQ